MSLCPAHWRMISTGTNRSRSTHLRMGQRRVYFEITNYLHEVPRGTFGYFVLCVSQIVYMCLECRDVRTLNVGPIHSCIIAYE